MYDALCIGFVDASDGATVDGGGGGGVGIGLQKNMMRKMRSALI